MRRAHLGRPADLRGARLGRRLGEPPVVPARQGQRPHGRRRGTSRLLQRGRPALGQPALRLPGHGARRLRVVDQAHRRREQALRRDSHRPLPRLRELLGGALRRHHRQARHVGQGARHGSGRTSLENVSRPVLHRGGSRVPDARGQQAPRRLGLPGHEGARVRLRLA